MLFVYVSRQSIPSLWNAWNKSLLNWELPLMTTSRLRLPYFSLSPWIGETKWSLWIHLWENIIKLASNSQNKYIRLFYVDNESFICYLYIDYSTNIIFSCYFYQVEYKQYISHLHYFHSLLLKILGSSIYSCRIWSNNSMLHSIVYHLDWITMKKATLLSSLLAKKYISKTISTKRMYKHELFLLIDNQR